MALLSFAFRSPVSARTCLVALAIAAGQAAAEAQEPAAQERERPAAGRATYRQFCAPCHGPDGKGHGPIASFLLKAPADVTQIRRRNGVFPQADLDALLRAATRTSEPPTLASEMFLWGPLFQSIEANPESARARVAELLAFIETLQED